MKFSAVGSGSKGNALVVCNSENKILIDCGLRYKHLQTALSELEMSAEMLDAVFITHEHSDHIAGLQGLVKKHPVEIYMTRGTALAANCGDLPNLNLICDQQTVSLGSLSIKATLVPHDAREPCQFTVTDHKTDKLKTLGILTDLGSSSEHVIEAYKNCDALVLECNHDEKMLREGPYPPSLKQRVLGNWGHLSNRQASELLGKIEPQNLQWLVLAHLSQKNNTPDLALEEITKKFPDQSRLKIAEQDQVMQWLAVN